MFKMLKILIILSGMVSLSAHSSVIEKTDFGEQSFDNLPLDYELTINDFKRLGKVISVTHTLAICDLKYRSTGYDSYISNLEYFLKKYDINLQNFKERGFVNIECHNGNFIFEVMNQSADLFERLLDYNFDFNRPVVSGNKVGTLLDFALEKLKTVNRQDARELSLSVRKLKEKKFKTCKELNLKCSIDS